MKKIYKQLCKLFPNIYLLIQWDLTTEGNRYQIYIRNNTLYTYNWSNTFNTLKELDKDLAKRIDGYKQVYKD